MIRRASCSFVFLVASLGWAARASASDTATTTHTYVEGRLGAVGIAPLGTKDGGTLHYGPAIEASVGIAWTWLDLGLVGRYGTVPSSSTTESGNKPRTSYVAFGPELAVRKWLGANSTLRLGIVPLYATIWGEPSFGGQPHHRVGADVLVQYLFTLDEESRPAWRAGIGLRAGRWASTATGETGWTAGVDLLVRSWW